MRTISERIADFTLELTFEQIPANVIGYGKLLLMDTFGVAMANLEAEHAQAIRRVVTENGSRPVCTLWGSADQVPVSYTHLDVYKRQVYIKALPAGRALRPPDGCGYQPAHLRGHGSGNSGRPWTP